jgi:hypothetical protein
MRASCFSTNAFDYLLNIAKKNEIEALKDLKKLETCSAIDNLTLMIRWQLNRIAELVG